MNRRSRQFSLLVVRGDGIRVVRFNFDRRVAVAVFVALAIAVSALGAVLGDWVKLRQLTRDAAVLPQQIAEQRATIDGVNRRLAVIRAEMASWRELHARIQEAFGPEVIPGARTDRAMGGGGAPPEHLARLTPTDELNRLTETVMEESANLRSLERLLTRAGKALAALPSRWPVRGAVNSEFGNRLSPWAHTLEFHSGLDIRAGMGTPVHAPASGTIAFAGAQPQYGNAIIVDHGNEIRTLYGHLSQIAVHAGQHVDRGTVIGYTGNTGRSSGPHLHYEILVKGHAVNPRSYLWD